MQLTRIAGTTLHGRLTFTHAIDPVTVFIGANESGKSTRLRTIDLVVAGPKGSRFPVLGVPDYAWAAQLSFDDTTVVTRAQEWKSHRDKPRSLEHGLVYGCGMNVKTGVRAAGSAVKKAVGQGGVWDIGDFLDLSPQKALRFLEDKVLAGTTWDPGEVATAVSGIASTDNEFFELLDNLNVPGWATEEAAAVCTASDGRPALMALIQATRDRYDNQQALARSLGGAIDRAKATRDASDLPGGTVAEWEAKRAELDQRIGAQREAIGIQKGRATAVDAAQRDLDAAQRDLDGFRSREWDKEIAESNAQRKAADDAVGQAVAAETAASKAVPEAEAGDKAARAADRKAAAAASGARAAIAAAEATREAADAAIEVVTALQVLVEQIEGDDHARSATHEGAAVAREVLEAWTPPTDADVLRLQEAFNKADTHRRAASTGAGAASRSADRARAAKRAASTAVTAAGRKASTAVDRVAAITADQQAEVGLAEAVTAATMKLADLGSSNVDAATTLLTTLTEERAEVQGKIDRLGDVAEAIANLHNSRAQLAETQKAAKATHAAHRALVGVMETFLGKMMEPLAAPVSAITSRVLDGATFHPRVANGFRYRLDRDGRSLGHGSRSVDAVAMMSLRSAVVSRLGGWRMLGLDDMENLEPVRRTRFLEAMVEEVAAGRLDNFLGACVAGDGWEPPAGVRVVRLP